MNKILKKLLAAVTIGVLITLIVGVLASLNPLNSWHNKISNNLYKEGPPSEDIVIIAIDDKSIKMLGKYYNWSREYYAQVIKNLEENNINTIGIDLAFNEPKRGISAKSLGEMFTNEETIFETIQDYAPFSDHPEDLVLAEVVNDYENIIFGGLFQNVHNINIKDSIVPLKIFTDDYINDVGFTDSDTENQGTVRKLRLTFNEYLSFALNIAQKFTDNKIDLNKIPLEDGQMNVNYFGPRFSYNYLSFGDVYQDSFHKPEVSGKIALIGITSELIGQDNAYTPTSTNVKMPGVEIHANAIQTILDEKFLTNQSLLSQIITIALLAIALTIIVAYAGIIIGATALILSALLYTIAAFVLFKNGLVINMIYPYIALLLAYIATTLYKYFAEYKEKAYIKNAFNKYLSPNVMKNILENPKLLQLGGTKKEVSVLFTDIANFTHFSEGKPPEELIQIINQYLTDMTEAILESDGTLDKYVGDEIMAYFGAPLDQSDHAVRACNVALKMRAMLPEFNKKHGTKLDFRVGINTGEVIVGNVGSTKRFDYTIMGDNVNLGSRLESANKKYETNVMISEDTYKQTGDAFIVRELDLIRVKGKDQPVKVYELLAKKGMMGAEGMNLIKQYNKGIELYKKRNFANAFKEFEKALELYSQDGPSKMYKQRCEVLRDFPPKDDWDGVFTMQSK